MKAVFLDRDGVLNRERGDHTWRVQDFEINTDVPHVLKSFQEKGYALIVITNQSGIALEKYGHDDVATVHQYLIEQLAAYNIKIKAIYYCPHREDTGKCLCRKPGSLMLEKALARFNIDASKSFMIGDSKRDIKAAENVGVKGILIESNTSLSTIE